MLRVHPVRNDKEENMEIGSMRGTPFHSSTAARTNSTWWYGWGGYVVPDVYTDLYTELTVDWADYWGCALGSAPVTTCEYPFIELGSRP